MNGTIYTEKFYYNTTWTQTQVDNDFNAGTTGTPVSCAGLTVWYKFNESSGTTIKGYDTGAGTVLINDGMSQQATFFQATFDNAFTLYTWVPVTAQTIAITLSNSTVPSEVFWNAQAP
jgi:hypothetical protein